MKKYNSEEEFLKDYDSSCYEKLSMTTDILIVSVSDQKQSNYYDLNYDLEDLQRNYVFSSKSSESVPQALYVFFQSNGFEDSIRKALSIGGDSDTIACIVGSISESYYGISDELKCEVKPYIKDYMLPLVEKRYYSNYEKEKK